MNERLKQQQLLDDVLDESSPSDFRQALLDEMLRLARRRRRWRQARRFTAATGLMLLTVWLAAHDWSGHSTKRTSAARPAPAVTGCRVVATQPLPPGKLVSTGRFAAVPVVSSGPTVAQVSSGPGGFRYINDAQLLSFAGARPTILIRTGPETEELVFADGLNAEKRAIGN